MATQKFTVDQMVKALTESRGLVSIAARKLECDQQTVRNYAARYPRVQQAMTDQRDTLIDSAELRLVEAVEKKGEPWAISLVLKTIGKQRGYVERVEQTGKDGDAIEVSHSRRPDLSGMSHDELRVLREGIRRARARGATDPGE